METPESKLKKKICNYLNDKNIYFFRKNQEAGDQVGIPDLIAIGNNGQFVGIEIKVKPYKQSDAQKVQQKIIEKNKGIYILAYSVDDVSEIFSNWEETK